MSEQTWRVINEVVFKCRGWVESILLTSSDGQPLAYSNMLHIVYTAFPYTLF